MAKKLYVGNVSWSVTSDDLRAAFAAFGEVEDAAVIKDKISGRSRGFGFVTFVNDADADNAIAQMHGKDLKGREITVNEARPREEGEGGGGRFGGGGGGFRPRSDRGDFRGGNSRGGDYRGGRSSGGDDQY